MNPNLKPAAIAFALLSLAACRKQEGAEIARHSEGGALAASSVIPVETLKLKAQPFEDAFFSTGAVEPEEVVTISAEGAGRILAMGREIGDEVKKGEALVTIDDASIQARLKQLKAQLARVETTLETARKDHAREEDLYKSKVGAERGRDDAKMKVATLENDLAAARAEIELANVELARAAIRAPFDAVISEKHSAAGEYAIPGFRLYTLVLADTVKFAFSLAERDIVRVKPGDEIPVEIDALPGERFASRVKSVSPAGNAQTRTFKVWATIENPHPHRLLSGMSGKARVVRQRFESVYLLPEEAVLREGGRSVVYVANDAHARPVEVKAIGAPGSKAIIAEGLTGEFDAIILGQYAIKPGDAVRVRRAHETIPERKFD